MNKGTKVLIEDFNFIANNLKDSDKDFLQNKSILVTGASGFLLSYLVKFLLYLNKETKSNLKIYGMVRSYQKALKVFQDSEEFIETKELCLIEQDVQHPFELSEEIDIIIHAASQASPKFYGVDPIGTAFANTLGTINCLELAKKKKVDSFLFFSSGEVYGDVREDQVPIIENDMGIVDPMNVRSCYAESKRMGENFCACYFKQYGVPAKVVRPFHTYGPGLNLDDGRVYCDFVKNIINNEDIVLKSEGLAVRSFCYIADATLAFLTVLIRGQNGEAYNVGNPECTISIKDLAKLLVDLFPEKNLKVQTKKRIQNNNYLETPIRINSPNVDKISTLGLKPKYDLKDGFTRTVESFL